MGNRIRDLVFVMVVIAGLAYWKQKPAQAPAATPVPPAPVQSAGFPDTAPPFTLHSNLGPPRSFDGKGPLVVVLTAVGCGECVQRIPRDREIYAMAQRANIPYYNILVYIEDDAAGAKFAQQHHPVGDDILNDPGGRVFVSQYKGSDNNCQMVIGRKGEFLYRGPENKEAMQKAIGSL